MYRVDFSDRQIVLLRERLKAFLDDPSNKSKQKGDDWIAKQINEKYFGGVNVVTAKTINNFSMEKHKAYPKTLFAVYIFCLRQGLMSIQEFDTLKHTLNNLMYSLNALHDLRRSDLDRLDEALPTFGDFMKTFVLSSNAQKYDGKISFTPRPCFVLPVFKDSERFKNIESVEGFDVVMELECNDAAKFRATGVGIVSDYGTKEVCLALQADRGLAFDSFYGRIEGGILIPRRSSTLSGGNAGGNRLFEHTECEKFAIFDNNPYNDVMKIEFHKFPEPLGLDEQLYMAVDRCELQNMEQLIAEGADVNFQAPWSLQSPLFLAVLACDFEMIERLLATGKCNLLMKDKTGRYFCDRLPLVYEDQLKGLVRKYHPETMWTLYGEKPPTRFDKMRGFLRSLSPFPS